MAAYVFLMVLGLIATPLFSGGCISSQGGNGCKKNQILPDCRRRVQIGSGTFIQSSKMMVVSLPEHSPSSSKYHSDHSCTHGSWGSGESSESAMGCGYNSSAAHVSHHMRLGEKAYEELWLECKKKIATSYEWLRRSAAGLKNRSSQSIENMSAIEVFRRFVKRHNVYAEWLAPLLYGQLFQANVWHNEKKILLFSIEWQVCPKCHVIHKTFRPERLCACGTNLILPQNIDETYGLFTQIHKGIAALLLEIITFNEAQRLTLASKR